MAKILVLMLTAMLIENYIFTQFLGICPFLGVSEHPSTALGMGCAVMFVMTISNGVTGLFYRYVLVPCEIEYLETVTFILIIASLVQFIEMLLKKIFPSLYSALGIYLPLITTNCAVLGAAILSVDKGYGLIESVAYGFSSAAGFTIAILIFAGVREKMKFSNPPKCFKGIPIALVAAGLIAMAFAGFAGIEL